MPKLVMVLCLVLTVAPCAAMEIPFRDGSVVEAVSYTVTGSYVMLEMAGGGQVAYDVADIDLDALRRAEAATAGEPEPAPEGPPTTLGEVGTLRVPEETPAAPRAGVVITDQHVKHVRGSGIAGPEDEIEEPAAEEAAVPEGFEEGGGVLLNNVKVSPMEGGQWQVEGEVINRTSDTVLDVRANLQANVPGDEPWSASVPVSGILGPDEKVTFTHTFASPSEAGADWSPQVQVSVVWMRSETRLEPNYNRLAPHPSSLPLDRGGVGGADTREQDEPDIPL
jgi:hypothetical protein